MEKNLLTSKLLGGIGATLCVLSIIPHLGTIAGIAGIITVLISLNMFSKIFNDPQIFKNALISVIISIIAVVLIFFTIGLGFFFYDYKIRILSLYKLSKYRKETFIFSYINLHFICNKWLLYKKCFLFVSLLYKD